MGNIQPYKYNAKELDTSKGLNWYDYGARHYDAALGRFTTVDPLAEKYYGMGLYAYCGGNPVRYIDPDGKFPIWAIISGGLDYGLQVYDNYKNGKSGYDAWIGNIDFLDVGLSAVNPAGKFKIAKTLLVEGTKAVIDITANKGVFKSSDDVQDIITKTFVNTVVNVGVGKVIDAGSKKAVQNANKEVVTANQRMKTAERQALRSPNSPKKAESVKNAQSQLQSARNNQVRAQILNSTIGKVSRTTQKGASIITDRTLRDEEERTK